MTPDERLERYADLVVRVGANVQEGQEVVLFHQVEHVPIARAVARAAYRAGARRVYPEAADLHIRKAAIELGPEEELGVTPPHFLGWAKTWHQARPAIIQLTGNPDPGLFAGLDPALVNWVIVPAPNEGWAQTIFGEPDVERLWQAVATAMRLDADDPVQAWHDHAAALRVRADQLNEHGFDAVRFRGPGTDLVVGLLEASRWLCATFKTTSGIEHLPNIPTEEVFTTPDWRRTTGVVRSTYPLIVPGVFARVDGLEVRFEEGRIVDVQADGDGAAVISSQLESDPQAPFLGEIALVDGASRIRQTGLVFHDTLFDENASCLRQRAPDGG
jgi:aminopeptidase